MGNEGVGVVEAVGSGVTVVKPGDRVAYQGVVGAYADVRTVPAEKLVVVPKGVDDRTAAAAYLKGLTAYYLLHRTFKVSKGHTILWHAAAGGVGQIGCQWAKALGATVIGTVGSDDKRERASTNGCDHVINYRSEDYVARVKEITGGVGVDVAYDSVGADTFPATLDCIRPIGTWVTFGNASGPVPAFPPLLLMQKGSLFATRPTTGHYLAKRSDLEAAAAALFAVIADGTVKVAIGQTFALSDAVAAHQALEARKTTGATVLIP
jgi:NADPH2:quinone reductase